MNSCTGASPPWIVFDGTVFVELCVVVVESKSVVVRKEEVFGIRVCVETRCGRIGYFDVTTGQILVTGSVFACAISTCLDRRYLN